MASDAENKGLPLIPYLILRQSEGDNDHCRVVGDPAHQESPDNEERHLREVVKEGFRRSGFLISLEMCGPCLFDIRTEGTTPKEDVKFKVAWLLPILTIGLKFGRGGGFKNPITWRRSYKQATTIAIEKMNETLLSFYFKTPEMHA